MKIAEDVRERIDDVLFSPRLTVEQRTQATNEAISVRRGVLSPDAWLRKWDPDAPKPVDDYEPQPEEQAVAVRDPGWDRAKNHYQQSGVYARRSVEEAWRCGHELRALRERTPHGQWIPSLQSEGIERTMAHRFMQIAEHIEMSQLATFGSVRSALEHVQGLLSIDQESRAPEPAGPTAADYEDATPAGEPADDAPQPTMFDDEAEPEPKPAPETPAAPVVVTPVADEPEPAPAPPTERAEVRPAEPRRSKAQEELDRAKAELAEANREKQMLLFEKEDLEQQVKVAEDKLAQHVGEASSVGGGIAGAELRKLQAEKRTWQGRAWEWQQKYEDERRLAAALKRQLKQYTG